MLEKYYKKLNQKILEKYFNKLNQVALLITVVLIIGFFVKIDMNVLLIQNAQKISLKTPFLFFILMGVLFLNGLIAVVLFVKERQKNKLYQEEKDVV
jgi:heme/copper-type cytochrome/quinol oxidase subunit 1